MLLLFVRFLSPVGVEFEIIEPMKQTMLISPHIIMFWLSQIVEWS